MIRLTGLGVCLMLILATCRNKEDEIVISSALQVNCSVAHHAVPVPFAKVYIKQGTNTYPGSSPSFYDYYYDSDSNGKVTFADLPTGKHLFFAVGWDLVEMDSVSGYMMLQYDLKPGEQKELNLTIPVSE